MRRRSLLQLFTAAPVLATMPAAAGVPTSFFGTAFHANVKDLKGIRFQAFDEASDRARRLECMFRANEIYGKMGSRYSSELSEQRIKEVLHLRHLIETGTITVRT